MGQPVKRAVVVAAGQDAEAATDLLRTDGWQVLRSGDGTADEAKPSLLVVDEWTAETAPQVMAARRAGIPVTVLAELILERTPRRVVAVTGTAGKTTTSRLLATILAHDALAPLITPHGRAANAWPNAALVGQALVAGGPLVVELTSTHLCYMEAWSGPDVAVVTNLWPDHVELHGSLAAYVAAKRRILVRSDRPMVLNADDHRGRALLDPPRSHDVVWFSQSTAVPRGAWLENGVLRVRWDGSVDDVAVIGPAARWMHPGAVVAAAAAALACGARPAAIATALASAPQLPHRFHEVGQVAGVRVIDDSMAATPAKASAAIGRCDPCTLVLIVGGDAAVDGRAVHADPDGRAALEQAIDRAANAAHLIAFGTAAARIADRCESTITTPTLGDAIAVAADLAQTGSTILLAPMFPVVQPERATFGERMLRTIADRR
jgi:UDP-N-acetylmuramoylalanine--D-glutamate ligase